ncbi:MAG TPA: NAD(P)/FAD-dependent oxidoreductase [Steroidobacteraceae bacterium]|nr:NAD(P)/FAD-dependent oxidoreductase [Steroidobacteraceae bacterium]
MHGRPRVVVVGCGFGGLFAARALKRAPADVLVIDHNNYHLFQPLLYQVAAAALAPADIAQPIRTILRYQANAAVMLGEVDRADLDEQYVHAGDSSVPYDYLILAPGAVDNYFGHSEWHGFAPGMKEVEDATLIRSRMLRSFETAEIESQPDERAAHLAFVIVGGGPTGVELAGAIKELAVDVIASDFRVADTRRARVVLIEAGPRLLPAMHPDSSERALEQLHGLGVEVLLGKPVTAIFADGVEVGGERIHSYNVIWAAGVKAAPLVGTLGAEAGPGGRVKVRPDCSGPGHPIVFVIGDAAYLIDSASGKQVPGVSQGALQMGRYVAQVIDAELRGAGETAQKLRAAGFHYKDLGSMATVGKSRAVVEIGRLHFGGLLAWFAWMALHVTVLIGFRNRLAVLFSWVYSYIFFRRGSRLITGLAPTGVKQPIAPATSTLQSPPSP